MFNRLLQLIGLIDTPPGKVARLQFQEEYPEYKIAETRIRAAESNRFVVAVFYTTPYPVRPIPYKLYAVNRDLREVEELPCNPDSPYWIRGRR
jgi:hypothetical protein